MANFKLFFYLCNLSIIVFVETLQKEIWSLDYFKEIFFGKHAIISGQSDNPPSFRCCNLNSMRFKNSKVVIQRYASLSIFVKLKQENV